MPYVDLQSADDWASIYYRTNTPLNNVGSFDANKPTAVMLHGLFLDSTWLDNQFGEPRLSDNYNLIAFDMRVNGRSSARPSGKHDSWVEAADLALCFQKLRLPACHILALETISVNCALRFAILFPELTASLTLCNVPPPTELAWVFTAYDELLQRWCFSPDLESFELSATEAVRFLAGPNTETDLQDDIIEYWEIWNHPGTRVRTLESVNILMNRVPLGPEQHKYVTAPTLIIHGDRNETCPIKFAEKLVSELTNAKDGAILYTVKGACGYLNIVPGTANIVNQVFIKFLSRLQHTKSEFVAPSISSIHDRMAQALVQLSEIVGDRTIATKDPMSSLSFSCTAPDVVKSQDESLRQFRKGEHTAFVPLTRQKRPIRRFSERTGDHWFHGEKDGLSYAGSLLQTSGKQQPALKQQQHAMEKILPLPESEPAPAELQQGRIRRATITPNINTVDRTVIKGSMAKVVGTTNTLSRLLS